MPNREQKITDDQLYNPSLTVGLWYEVGVPIVKFTIVGEYVTGTWIGTEPGQYAEIGIIQTADGIRRFSITVMLRDRLRQVKVGAAVTILFQGFKPLQSNPNHMQKMFRVFVPSPTDVQTGPIGDGLPRAKPIVRASAIREQKVTSPVRRFRRIVTEEDE